jgi:hypothetical protein
MGRRQAELEEHVEEAEQAEQTIQRQAEEIERIAPPAVETEQRRVERTTEEAERSVGELGDIEERLGQLLRDPDILRAVRSMERMGEPRVSEAERRYRAADEGMELETVLTRPAEVTAHRERREREGREVGRRLEEERYREEQRSGSTWSRFTSWLRRIGRAIANFFRGIGRAIARIGGYVNITAAVMASRAQDIHQEVRGWMRPEYLGRRTHERFTEHPPVLAMERGMKTAGLYMPFTNGTVLDPVDMSSTDQMYVTIVHEQLHYASHLNGGGQIRWRDDEGGPAFASFDSNRWLHEGLTELHAQQLARARGHEHPPSYPAETTIGFYLQRIVGEDTLREAYFSGDFTEVRREVNERLGEGTFEAMLSSDNGQDALVFLVSRLEAAGIDTSEWDRDPIVEGAGVV